MATKNELHVDTSSETKIAMTRHFAAPKQAVFEALTTKEALEQWWGPNGFTTEVPTLDVKPGGTWHYCMRSEEWGDAWGIATYKEVTPYGRLVLTDAFSDENGAIIPPESTVTIELNEDGEGTRMTWTSEYPTREDRDKVVEMGMEEGSVETMDKLEAFLAGTLNS